MVKGEAIFREFSRIANMQVVDEKGKNSISQIVLPHSAVSGAASRVAVSGAATK